MNNRTMATVYVDRDSISLKTRSRNGCSPQQFIILKKELQRLKDAGRDSVSGYTERIRLPYEPFRAYAAGEEETVDGTR